MCLIWIFDTTKQAKANRKAYHLDHKICHQAMTGMDQFYPLKCCFLQTKRLIYDLVSKRRSLFCVKTDKDSLCMIKFDKIDLMFLDIIIPKQPQCTTWWGVAENTTD